MTNPLQILKDAVAKQVFGMTPAKAQELGICICCKKPVDTSSLTTTDRDEYYISKLCPDCFDTITSK